MNMSVLVTLDSAMMSDLEALAARNGVSAAEYITQLVAEAIEDAHDYDRCSKMLEDHEKDPVAYSHEDIMREFGLR